MARPSWKNEYRALLFHAVVAGRCRGESPEQIAATLNVPLSAVEPLFWNWLSEAIVWGRQQQTQSAEAPAADPSRST